MAKRIVTKMGDIFCVEIDNGYKRFFQYIINDIEALNSSVIRVFKTHHPMDYRPIIEEIVMDEVEFYAHTVLRAGIVYGAWYKVGNSKEIGEGHKDVLFGTASDVRVLPNKELEFVSPSENWYVWHINEPPLFVGKLTEKYKDLEQGDVMSYVSIIDRLRNGRYMRKCQGNG